MKKRKSIPDKLRLKILKRDKFTCQSCGKSPAQYPELEIDAVPNLEIDHYQPHSKEGTDDIENLQTLCIFCNRGKGNEDYLNHSIKEKMDSLLNLINPEILVAIQSEGTARVVANDSDFGELQRINALSPCYKIDVIPNTITGYRAMYNAGIYTVNDNHAGKVIFIIRR